jgi:hypothetical protein
MMGMMPPMMGQMPTGETATGDKAGMQMNLEQQNQLIYQQMAIHQ